MVAIVGVPSGGTSALQSAHSESFGRDSANYCGKSKAGRCARDGRTSEATAAVLRLDRPLPWPKSVVPERWLCVNLGMRARRLDFADFYRESKDGCLLSVLVSVGDRDTAQDLVDEAFVRAWASWRSVSRHPAPAAWVVRTALNANVSRWRRRRREVSLPNPGTVAELADHVGGADGSIDPRIVAALMKLPARQRQVVTLRLLLDLDTNRTAEVLGVSPSAVKAHLARAIAALRRDLMPEHQQEIRS
jgi:RNA polymerase sigma factor (sigma-70 family)